MKDFKNTAFVASISAIYLASTGCGGVSQSNSNVPYGRVFSASPSQESAATILGAHSDPPPGKESLYDEYRISGSPVTAGTVSPVARFYVLKSTQSVQTSGVRKPQEFYPGYADIVVEPGDQCGAVSPMPSSYCLSWSYVNKIDPSCGSLNWYLLRTYVPASIAMPFTPINTTLTGSVYVSITSPGSNLASLLGKFPFTIGAVCTSSHPHGVLPSAGYFFLGNVQVAIVDQTNPGAGDLVTLEDQVGAQESLFAQTTPAAAESYMANPINWTIPSNPNVLTPYVAGYTQSNTSSSVTLPVITSANPLSFYPTAPYGAQYDGTDPLKFSAKNLSPGTAYHASIAYIIHAPSIDSVAALMGQIFVGDGLNCGGQIACTALQAAAGENSPHGIDVTTQWSSDSPYVHGAVGMTQLADITIYEEFPQPGPSPYEYNDYYPSVDSGPQYGQANGQLTSPLAASGSASYHAIDDNLVALYPCQSKVWPYFGFTDFFTFQPDAKGSFNGIPVTLGTITWQWEASTTNTGSGSNANWLSPQIWSGLISTPLTPSTTLPIWFHNAYTELGYNKPC